MKLQPSKRGVIMNRKLLASLAIFIFLSFGSSLLADHYTFANMVQIGTIQSGNDNDLAEISALAGETLTLAGKSDESGDGWSGTNGSTSSVFTWDGSGVITHITIKAGNYYTLFSLINPLNPGDSQEVIQDQIMNPPGNAYLEISHTSAFFGTTSVPEPATLVLLGLGLMAVPVAKKFRF